MIEVARSLACRARCLAALQLLALSPIWSAHAAEPSPGAPANTSPGAEVDAKQVNFVPEIVKAQLREEIKQEVLETAKKENWAAPNAIPAWAQRFTLKGDVRARYERILFGHGNATGYPDFNAINTNKPFDVNFIDTANERYANVDRNRTRPRLSARLEVDADLGQGFNTALRLASGSNNSPVSTTQTLGNTFGKYDVWLDRAAIRYESKFGNIGGVTVDLGRFENPFLGTDLVWSDNVNFDGLAARGRFQITPSVEPFLTVGAFPVYNTPVDFAPDRINKFGRIDKWLYSAQVGTKLDIADILGAKFGAALHYYRNIEGRMSGPCDTHLKDQNCDTDISRPSFAQKGNTYMMLRSPSDAAIQAYSAGAAPEYQYFGLASRFREVVLTGRLDLKAFRQLKIGLDGEYVHNPGFSKKHIAPVALNNLGTCDDQGQNCAFVGGNKGYMGRLTVGSPTMSERWDWGVGLGYRHLESDAALDAFTNSDFGLGGTNLKGFVVDGTLALAKNVTASVRWMSADAVAGPKYSVDVLQVDLTARY